MTNANAIKIIPIRLVPELTLVYKVYKLALSQKPVTQHVLVRCHIQSKKHILNDYNVITGATI
jgi:hypothetical protein